MDNSFTCAWMIWTEITYLRKEVFLANITIKMQLFVAKLCLYLLNITFSMYTTMQTERYISF